MGNNKFDIFISFANGDIDIVKKIVSYIEANGYHCFVSGRDIPAGETWASAIVEALEQCRIMVAIYSDSYNQSVQVDREIEIFCDEEQKPIIPFRLSNSPLKGAKKYFLKNLNWIDAFEDYEASLPKLLREIAPNSTLLQYPIIHRVNLHFKEELKLRADHSTKHIIIHHSEVSSPHSVRDIHIWHQKKGWAGIGYHYYIRKNGEIYEGRPHNTVGAHAYDNNKNYDYNKESIGVDFEGNFNKETMSDIQLEASVVLLSLLSLAYGNADICMHRQLVANRSCPGKNFPFEKLKSKVEECKKYLQPELTEEEIISLLNPKVVK